MIKINNKRWIWAVAFVSKSNVIDAWFAIESCLDVAVVECLHVHTHHPQNWNPNYLILNDLLWKDGQCLCLSNEWTLDTVYCVFFSFSISSIPITFDYDREKGTENHSVNLPFKSFYHMVNGIFLVLVLNALNKSKSKQIHTSFAPLINHPILWVFFFTAFDWSQAHVKTFFIFMITMHSPRFVHSFTFVSILGYRNDPGLSRWDRAISCCDILNNCSKFIIPFVQCLV